MSLANNRPGLLGPIICLIVITINQVSSQQVSVQPVDDHSPKLEDGPTFRPRVSGRCERGRMLIAVAGAPIAHVRGFRWRPACVLNSTMNKDGVSGGILSVNLLASQNDGDFCGVLATGKNEKSLPLAVRAHSSLELSDDRFFLLTCSSLSSASSGRQPKALLDSTAANADQLHLIDTATGDKANRGSLVIGHGYRIEVSKDSLLTNCVAFDPDSSQQVTLTDGRGCALDDKLAYLDSENSLILRQAFRFPTTTGNGTTNNHQHQARTSIQCTRTVCSATEECPNMCTDEAQRLSTTGSGTRQLLSSTWLVQDSVDCTQQQLTIDWLVGLLILFAVLLVIMFCVNCFLCSSLSCTCTRLERETEQDDGRDSYYDAESRDYDMDAYDYDPYKGQQHLPMPTMAPPPRSHLSGSHARY